MAAKKDARLPSQHATATGRTGTLLLILGGHDKFAKQPEHMEFILPGAAQQIICSRPFEWFEVHPDGSVFLCCPTWLKRPIGNLLQQRVEEIWNGPVAREIRKSINNGSFHNCSRQHCPHLTTVTPPVYASGQELSAATQATLREKSGLMSTLPRHLNLCFDHSCNLACPSCRNQAQQAHGPELERVQQISQVVLAQLLPAAHSVTLSGFGDPFGSPSYLRLLKQLNRQDFPHLRQVRLHTNGQLLTQLLWQEFPALHPLISAIEVSIDAASEATYRLNRPGGNFFQLLTNLEFMTKIGCALTLSMVVQSNNWREIPRFLLLAERFQARAYLSKLVNWGSFSKAEYLHRAVHLNSHPEHKAFVDLLKSCPDKNIDYGNLAPIKT